MKNFPLQHMDTNRFTTPSKTLGKTFLKMGNERYTNAIENPNLNNYVDNDKNSNIWSDKMTGYEDGENSLANGKILVFYRRSWAYIRKFEK